MPVFVEWQNANESRNYPLHDLATRLALSGELLPNNILTDAQLLVPKSAGIAVVVSSVGITPSLVTVTFSACPIHPFLLNPSSSSSGAPNLVPLAAVKAVRPVSIGRLYQVDSIYPGMTGWISFGSGANSIEGIKFWNYSSPAQSVLQERCVTLLPGVPVEKMGKEGAAALLSGLIKLKGVAGSIKTYKVSRTLLIDGVEVTKDVGVIAMDLGEDRVTRLQEFAGPCRGRPNTQTCAIRPIEKINSVRPNENGDIKLKFEGSAVVGDIQRGIVVDYPIALDELCPYGFDPSIIEPPPGPPDPPTPPTPSSSSASPEYPSSSSSSSPEYCDDFEAGYAKELETIQGLFTVQEAYPTVNRLVSAAGSVLPQFSVDIYREMDASLAPYIVKATLKPRTVGGNGFLIAGYRSTLSFVFAGLSLRDGGKFFVGRKTISGGNWPNGLGYGYSFILPITRNYEMPVTDYRVLWLLEDDNSAVIKFEWNDGITLRTQRVAYSWPVGTFNALGRAGVGVVGSETEIDDYGINCGGSSSSGF